MAQLSKREKILGETKIRFGDFGEIDENDDKNDEETRKNKAHNETCVCIK